MSEVKDTYISDLNDGVLYGCSFVPYRKTAFSYYIDDGCFDPFVDTPCPENFNPIVE